MADIERLLRPILFCCTQLDLKYDGDILEEDTSRKIYRWVWPYSSCAALLARYVRVVLNKLLSGPRVSDHFTKWMLPHTGYSAKEASLCFLCVIAVD